MYRILAMDWVRSGSGWVGGWGRKIDLSSDIQIVLGNNDCKK